MQVWNAFAGYRDLYGRVPSAREVQRVRLYLVARNEYEYECYQEQQQKIAALEAGQSGDGGSSGRSIHVG